MKVKIYFGTMFQYYRLPQLCFPDYHCFPDMSRLLSGVNTLYPGAEKEGCGSTVVAVLVVVVVTVMCMWQVC